MNLGDPMLRAVRVLGEGTFGRVFLCLQHEGSRQQRQVCVKRIIVRNPKTELSLIKEEIYIISQLRHPNIVEFIRSFNHAGTVNIVMEYAPNGTLRDVIHHTASLPQDRLLRYFGDMVIGLEYLHIRNVIHRDIKPENMLLDAGDRVKIADFGISNVHAPSKQHLAGVGTPLYMAPEVMSGIGKVDYKSDIWSLGLVLYELCVGRSPFLALIDPGATPQQVHTVVVSLTRPKLDCQLIRRLHNSTWSRICELMVVYEQERRICVPEIFRLDPSITAFLYKQYFNYNYK
ncbi:aurora kinase A [Drosophila guanche]|uniref:Blast:Serine/threonine-protein kinase TIO n=1 Tax=Drosophila guanche TaxID=7266 RepID=A0A3B0KIL5_DROGU|nr:aurora kinase A [Drosophila guanche]SPP86269.1 blast:Serine/threonine-protein kinase TIO [Drosophila guanche]